MREQNNGVGMSGASSRLSLEVAKVFTGRNWLSEVSSPKRARAKRHSLWIEPLESRLLMDAAGLADTVAPGWFATVSESSIKHANVATYTAEGTIDYSSIVSVNEQASLYDWIVQFDTGRFAAAGIDSVAETASLLSGGGIDFQVMYGLGIVGQVLVRSSGASVDAVEGFLASNSYVATYETDAICAPQVTSNDPLAYTDWANTVDGVNQAWSISTGSASVVVAVIDTGVDYTHGDLAGNMWTNPGEIAGNGIDDEGNGFVDDVHGYDFYNNDGDPMDDDLHGTHVAGTIAAVGNNGVGVVGVNWTSSIMALKFMGTQGGSWSDAIRAINYATMMRSKYGVNIRVENNSWGGTTYSESLKNSIRLTGEAGILFVAAAGNSGTNDDFSPHYPASYDCSNIIAVAATDQYDDLADFSCYGERTVQIAAPGVNIYSTLPGGRYGSLSGTSMACPQVAGVAALAWAVAPNATMEQIRNAILNGADQLDSLSGWIQDGRRLNAYETLKIAAATPTPTPTPSLQYVSSVGLYDRTDTAFFPMDLVGFHYAPNAGATIAIAGDWNGDGVDTVGLYNPTASQFFLTNSNDSSGGVNAFLYGPANLGWIPIAGDWNGDGQDTIGLFDPSTSMFYLRNSNDIGYADITFDYGPANAGWKPIAGDWNGGGKDTIGLFDPAGSVFYLRNSNDRGFADTTFVYGPAGAGWTPIAGDWDGNGSDSIGLYDTGSYYFFLRDSNTTGYANNTFLYGIAGHGCTPVAGDWDGGSAVFSSQAAAATETKARSAGTMSVTSVRGVNAVAAVAASLVQLESAVGELRSTCEGTGASDITGSMHSLIAGDYGVDSVFALDGESDVRQSSEGSQLDAADRLALVESQIDLLLNEFGPTGRIAKAYVASDDVLADHQAEDLLACRVGERASLDGVFETIGETV